MTNSPVWYKTAISLALILSSALHLGNSALAAQETAPEMCSIRFDGFSEGMTFEDLEAVSLRGDVSKIQLLRPSEQGFFAIPVSSPSAEPLYGSKLLSTAVPTSEFSLLMKLQRVSWWTAAQPTLSNYAEIQPGHYRLVLNYLNDKPAKDDPVVLCIAFSPSFFLADGFVSLRFE